MVRASLFLALGVLASACRPHPSGVDAGEAGAAAASAASGPPNTPRKANADAAGTLNTGDAGADAGDELHFNLAPLPEGAPFEGIVSLGARRLEDAVPQVYVFTVKGKKVRWDLFAEAGKGAVRAYRIYDGDAHKFYTAAPELKEILVTDEVALTRAGPEGPEDHADGGRRARVDAGSMPAPARSWIWKPLLAEPKGNVANIACDRNETTDDDFIYEVCSAPGLVVFPMQLLPGALSAVVPFNASLQAKGVFPLHVIVRRRRGTSAGPPRGFVGSLQVERIERGRVPDDAFNLPNLPRRPTASLIFGRPPRR